MKTETSRNTILALAGLAALSVYVLACVSFSPDDTKVAYPAFDTASGGIGVAVYDRETRRSDLAFLPMMITDKDADPSKPTLMRSQWLADGQRILVSWVGDNAPDGVTLAVMPWNSRAALRLFCLPKLENFDLTRPLCVAGDRVFLMESGKQILRLDLKTGEIARHALDIGKSEITLLPVPNDSGVFYTEKLEEKSGTVFGRLNPDNFALSPLYSFTNDSADGSFFAYDPAGKRCAFLEKTEALPQLVVLDGGKPVFRRSIGAKGDDLDFSSVTFSKRGDSLLAGFARKREDQPVVSYGLMEIPLGDQPVREKVLLSRIQADANEGAFYFEFGISHDGKTAAAASTYLACAKEQGFEPEDCGLFFIDLSDPAWRVTKTLIPLPRQWAAPAVK